VVGEQLIVDVCVDHGEDLVVLDVVDEADAQDRRHAVERVVEDVALLFAAALARLAASVERTACRSA
jgi:hypothetical protein